MGALVAVLIGLPTLRLRGAYFAVTMLAFAEALRIIFTYFEDFTGGGSGRNVSRIIGQVGDIRLFNYYAIVFVAIIAFILTHYISYTRLGLSLRACRDSADGANSIGINVLRTKVITFALSGFLAGMAGAVYMIRLYFITPEEAFATSLTVEMIIITLLGGAGTVFGPIVGSLILVPLRIYLIRSLAGKKLELFGFILKLDTAYLLIYGLVFVIAILFLPRGIMGYLEEKGFVRRETLVDEEALEKEFVEASTDE